MEESFDISRLLRILKQNLFLIVFLMLIGAAAGFGFSKFVIKPTYGASASMLVNRSDDTLTSAAVNLADQQADVQIISTYKNLILSSNVLGVVADQLTNDDLTVNELKKMVSVSSQPNSQVFLITVKTDDPNLAAEIANQTANVFKTKIGGFMKINNVSIVDNAIANPIPVAPSKKMFTIIGFVLFGGLTFAYLLIRELTDTRIKRLEDVTQVFGITNLGVIGFIEEVNQKGRVNRFSENELDENPFFKQQGQQ